jgi:murein DD-endopeptidase MepM/ murein hydrolase activator NlpD
MQLQFHPASGRAMVRKISIGPAGERWLVVAAAASALLTVSLWFTVPGVALQAARRDRRATAGEDSRRAAAAAASAEREADDLKERARDAADRLNRIAFLYRVPVSAWPRALAPESRVLGTGPADSTVASLPGFLRALENGRAVLEAREREDPAAARELPAILPLEDALFEPSAYFGPRRSSWTGSDEFLAGVEIAAPRGTAVVAPADGTVAFAGTVRPREGATLWQLGSVVVLTHGERGATVFGHLGKIDVARGAKVKRGARLGAVGSSGWALSPQLHYEYWRSDGTSLRPTDPLFGILDHSLERKPYSLEQMEATWAPGPLEPLPGIDVSAESVAAGRPSPVRRVHKRRL